MSRLNKAAGKDVAPAPTGKTELRLHKLYLYLGYAGIAIATVFIGAAAWYRDTELYVIAFLMVGLFGGIGTLLLMNYRNHLLRFDDQWVTVHSWTGREQQVAWRDISAISFNAVSGYLLVEGPFKTLKIHHHLVGLKSFVVKVEHRVGIPVAGTELPFR